MDVEKMKIKSEEVKGRRQDVPRKYPLNNIEKILLPKNMRTEMPASKWTHENSSGWKNIYSFVFDLISPRVKAGNGMDFYYCFDNCDINWNL